jgi:hypothetical protein
VSSLAGGGGDGSEGTPWTLAEAIAAAVAGDRVNVKKDGTYTAGGDLTFAGVGTIANPIIWRGYLTTIGDGDLGRSTTTGRLVETNMPLINFADAARELLISGNYNIFQDIKITGISTAVLATVSGTGAGMENCVVENTNTGGASHAVSITSATGFATNCDFRHLGASGGAAAINCGSTGIIDRCRLSSTSGFGFLSAAGSPMLLDCIIRGCGDAGVRITSTGASAHVLISGCTIQGNTGTGVSIVVGYIAIMRILNCHITDNGGWGINDNGATAAVMVSNCRFRDNTSGNISIDAEWSDAAHGTVTTDTGGAATDYANTGNGDLRLIADAPGVDDSAMGQNIGACGTDPASIEAGVSTGTGIAVFFRSRRGGKLRSC